jgi:lysophospholipase L1-like esterase
MASSSSQLYQQLSNTQLNRLVHQQARFKQRSHDTHTRTHRPQLESSPPTTSPATLPSEFSPQIDIVLLGDSMLERFKTTGKYTQLGQLHYPEVFNAGVGGDRIENVLYRVDLGLLRLLKPRNPKCVVLHLGTNNLRPKQALERRHLDDYYLLLQALLRVLPTGTQILVTGLFKRKDVDEQYIAYSNRVLEELVARINTEEAERQVQQNDCVHWMEPPEEIELKHLDDNVHLNANGYQIWDAILHSKVQQLLGANVST